MQRAASVQGRRPLQPAMRAGVDRLPGHPQVRERGRHRNRARPLARGICSGFEEMAARWAREDGARIEEWRTRRDASLRVGDALSSGRSRGRRCANASVEGTHAPGVPRTRRDPLPARPCRMAPSRAVAVSSYSGPDSSTAGLSYSGHTRPPVHQALDLPAPARLWDRLAYLTQLERSDRLACASFLAPARFVHVPCRCAWAAIWWSLRGASPMWATAAACCRSPRRSGTPRRPKGCLFHLGALRPPMCELGG